MSVIILFKIHQFKPVTSFEHNIFLAFTYKQMYLQMTSEYAFLNPTLKNCLFELISKWIRFIKHFTGLARNIVKLMFNGYGCNVAIKYSSKSRYRMKISMNLVTSYLK